MVPENSTGSTIVPLAKILKEIENQTEEEIIQGQHVLYDITAANSALKKLLEHPTKIFATLLLADFIAFHLFHSEDRLILKSESHKQSSLVTKGKRKLSFFNKKTHLMLRNIGFYSVYPDADLLIDFARVLTRVGGPLALSLYGFAAIGSGVDLPLWLDLSALAWGGIQASDVYLFHVWHHRAPSLTWRLNILEQKNLKRAQKSSQKRDWSEVMNQFDALAVEYDVVLGRQWEEPTGQGIAQTKMNLDSLFWMAKRFKESDSEMDNLFLENLLLGHSSEYPSSDITFQRFFSPLNVSEVAEIFTAIYQDPFLSILLPKSLRTFAALPDVRDFIFKKEKWGRTEITLYNLGLKNEHLVTLASDYLEFLKTFEVRVAALSALYESRYFPMASTRRSDETIRGHFQLKHNGCSFHFL